MPSDFQRIDGARAQQMCSKIFISQSSGSIPHYPFDVLPQIADVSHHGHPGLGEGRHLIGGLAAAPEMMAPA